ncbi:unnamed protein product [Didymodactylos carnosus]|uniref:FLYWCH-type domain-containing protein n=1 Tax=Didymodactylos carnosus TaxID=1234261 RepID=A0A8S2H9Z5_9BILA|nr:unnamed protein product [Didymodactylos carnosus]CAF3619530.1 unnamed protein product [Didymodactylos carnosus]
MCVFVETKRKKPCLLFNGYRYVQDKRQNRTTYWRCELRATCNGRAHQIGRENPIETIKHNHRYNENRNHYEEFRLKIKKRICDERTAVRKIFRTEIIKAQKYTPDLVDRLPKFNQIKSSLYHTRNKNYPSATKSLTSESTILNPLVQSINDTNNNMLVSASSATTVVSPVKFEDRRSIDNNTNSNNRPSYLSEVITTRTNNSTDSQTTSLEMTKLLSNITTCTNNNNNDIEQDNSLFSSLKNNLSNETMDNPSCLNQFGWEDLDGRYIPVLFRNENGRQERYTSKIYVENTLFQNESWQRHSILAKSPLLPPLLSFAYTENELKLFRLIVEWHLAQCNFKSIPSTDCLIRFEDLIDYSSNIRKLRDSMPSTAAYNHHKQTRTIPFEISTINHTLHQQMQSNLTLDTHLAFISPNSKFVDSSSMLLQKPSTTSTSPQSAVAELLHRQQKQMKTYPVSPPNLLNSELLPFQSGYLPSSLLMPPNSYPFHFPSPRASPRQSSLIAPKPQTNSKNIQDLSAHKTHSSCKQPLPPPQLQRHSQQPIQYQQQQQQQHLMKQQSSLKNSVNLSKFENKPSSGTILHQYESSEKAPLTNTRSSDAKESGWVQINNVFVPYIVKLKLRDSEIDRSTKQQQLQREIYVPYEILIKCHILSDDEFLFKKFLIRATPSDFEIFNQLISNIHIFDEKVAEKTLLVNLYHIMIGLNRILYVKILTSKQPRTQVNKSHQDVLKHRGGTLRINDKLVPYLIQNNRYYVPLLYTYSTIANGVNLAKKFARAPRQFEIDYLNLLFLYFSIDNTVLTADTLLVDAYDIKAPNIQLIKHFTLIEHQQRERMNLNNTLMKLSSKKVHKNPNLNTSTMNSVINPHPMNVNESFIIVVPASCKQSKYSPANVVVNPLIHTAAFYGLSGPPPPPPPVASSKSISAIDMNKSGAKMTTSLGPPSSSSLSSNCATINPPLNSVQNTVVLNPALNALLQPYTKQHQTDIHSNTKLTKMSNSSNHKHNNSIKHDTNYHNYSHKTSSNDGVIVNPSLEKSTDKSSIVHHFNHYATASPPLMPPWALPNLNSLPSYTTSQSEKKNPSSNIFRAHQLALTKDILQQQHSYYQEQRSKSSSVPALRPPQPPLYLRPEIRSFQIRRRPFYGIVKNPETPIGEWKIPTTHILNQFASTIPIETFLQLCDNEFQIKLVRLDDDEKSLVSHHVGRCSADEYFIYHRDLERCIEQLLTYKQILLSLSTANYPSFPLHSPEMPVHENQRHVDATLLSPSLTQENTVSQTQKVQPAARKRKATVPVTRLPSNVLDEKSQQQQQVTVSNLNSIKSSIISDQSTSPQPHVEMLEQVSLPSMISTNEELDSQLYDEMIERSSLDIPAVATSQNEPNLYLTTPISDSTGTPNLFDALSSSPIKSISITPDDEYPAQFSIETISKNHISDTIPSCSSGYESSGFGGRSTAQSTDEKSPPAIVTISHLDEQSMNNTNSKDTNDTDGDSCRSRAQSYVSTELSFKEKEDDELLPITKDQDNSLSNDYHPPHSPLLQSAADRRRLRQLSCSSPPKKFQRSNWGEPVEICSKQIEKSLRTLNVNGGNISINETNETSQRKISSRKKRRRGRPPKKTRVQSSISDITKQTVSIPPFLPCSEDTLDHDRGDRSNDSKTTLTTGNSQSLDLCTDSNTSEIPDEIFTNFKCGKRPRTRTVSHEDDNDDDDELDRIVVQMEEDVDDDDNDNNHQIQSNSSDSNLFEMFDNKTTDTTEQQDKSTSLSMKNANNNSVIIPSQQDIPAIDCTYKIQCNPDRLSLTLRRIQK